MVRAALVPLMPRYSLMLRSTDATLFVGARIVQLAAGSHAELLAGVIKSVLGCGAVETGMAATPMALPLRLLAADGSAVTPASFSSLKLQDRYTVERVGGENKRKRSDEEDAALAPAAGESLCADDVVVHSQRPGVAFLVNSVGPKNATVTVLPGYGTDRYAERSKWCISKSHLKIDSDREDTSAAAKALLDERRAAEPIATGQVISFKAKGGVQTFGLVEKVGVKKCVAVAIGPMAGERFKVNLQAAEVSHDPNAVREAQRLKQALLDLGRNPLTDVLARSDSSDCATQPPAQQQQAPSPTAAIEADEPIRSPHSVADEVAAPALDDAAPVLADSDPPAPPACEKHWKEVCENGLLKAIYIYKRSFYQDRLGTNVGKAALKKRTVFSQMNQAEHEAADTLGWSESSWEAGDQAPMEQLWSALSAAQLAAAGVMGFNESDFTGASLAAESQGEAADGLTSAAPPVVVLEVTKGHAGFKCAEDLRVVELPAGKKGSQAEAAGVTIGMRCVAFQGVGLGKETPLFAPFIYKHAHFAKTGSGQT